MEITYRSEQQKALRDHFAMYKGLLLEAGESLNHRFWNFYYHEKAGWLDLRGHYFGNPSTSMPPSPRRRISTS